MKSKYQTESKCLTFEADWHRNLPAVWLLQLRYLAWNQTFQHFLNKGNIYDRERASGKTFDQCWGAVEAPVFLPAWLMFHLSKWHIVRSKGSRSLALPESCFLTVTAQSHKHTRRGHDQHGWVFPFSRPFPIVSICSFFKSFITQSCLERPGDLIHKSKSAYELSFSCGSTPTRYVTS